MRPKPTGSTIGLATTILAADAGGIKKLVKVTADPILGRKSSADAAIKTEKNLAQFFHRSRAVLDLKK